MDNNARINELYSMIDRHYEIGSNADLTTLYDELNSLESCSE